MFAKASAAWSLVVLVTHPYHSCLQVWSLQVQSEDHGKSPICHKGVQRLTKRV